MRTHNLAGEFGYFRVAAAVPKLRVADPIYNTAEIARLIHQGASDGIGVMVFPELCITGYTCQDLFYQKVLRDSALQSLDKLLSDTSDLSIVYAVGLPLLVNSKLYNCAVIAAHGEILGVVPKVFLPNTREFYEKRWFVSTDNDEITEIELLGQTVPFGRVLFNLADAEIVLGVEICEDLWAVTPPSGDMILQGANLIINLSASNELVAKAGYRESLVAQQSGRGICAYVYSSAGVHESTTDNVFSGDAYIAENNYILARGKRFLRDSSYITADIDFHKLEFERITNTSFSDNTKIAGHFDYLTAYYGGDLIFPNIADGLKREVSASPFVPKSIARRAENCEEIFNIQVAGLAKRLDHTGCRKVYIGISGGLDSTLALLVSHMTFKLLGLPLDGITGVTMPGFGTTDRTYGNAQKLVASLGVTLMDIDIRDSCMAHFKDIGHDTGIHDVTYENVQARERTQVLMDLANKHGGLVIGTGDLSELALGWCTYNGDHMSMYAVNSSVPKTLVKYLIEWIMDTHESSAACSVLRDVLDTPISPELLPPDADGAISQMTEDIVGPYELHDFFLFGLVRHGMPPRKLLFLAGIAFGEKYSEETIRKWLKIFISRFFSQQFKRSCLPDGPKVGSVALSPRGDWRMSSDSNSDAWLDF